MKHMGNLTVTLETANDFPAVDSFFGHLVIGENVELRAPDLVSLRGWITVMSGAGFAAPQLGRLEGWLTLRDGSSMMAEHLTEITADLIIGAHVNLDLPALQSVLGSVILQRSPQTFYVDMVAKAPTQELEVQSVRGSISVGESSALSTPHLGQVGGSITLREGAYLSAPLLAHIGGFYDAEPSAVLFAPNFTA